MRRGPVLLLVVLLATATAPLAAQNPESLVAAGVRAYRDLDFDAAAGFLTRATGLLASLPDTALRARPLDLLISILWHNAWPLCFEL